MRKVIKVANISCANCAKTIETHFNNLINITATVSVPNKKVIFEFVESDWNLDKIKRELKEIGYQPIFSSAEISKIKKRDLIDMIVAVFLNIPLLWTMFGHFSQPDLVPTFFFNGFFQLSLASIILFFCGRRFFGSAFRQIKNKRLGMDTLVVLGTLTAYLYSTYLAFSNINIAQVHVHYYFEATGTIIMMVLIGNLIENNVKEHAIDTLESLLNLTSKEAVIKENDTERLVPIVEVKIGDKIIVKANEIIPLDGVIIDGKTYVDEATMTGEAMPKKKEIADNVLAATTNLLETITVEVTVNPSETQFAKVIKTIENTAKIKPKAQKTADKIAAIFVPLIVMIAIITFFIWLFFIKDGSDTRDQIDSALSASIAVLVISCPCALGLATPMSISTASMLAFKNHILFKSGEYFEISPRITTVCFDKTGTLTKGKPVITDYYGDYEALRIPASLEKHSNHPLAGAVLNYYHKHDYYPVTDFKVQPGRGLSGIIDGNEAIVASAKVINQLGIDNHYHVQMATMISEGKTVFFTIYNNTILNMFVISDAINEYAKTIIDILKKRGIKTCLLTGDSENAARLIQRQTNLDKVYYELMPTDKMQIIQSLQADGETVAFVGDGVNDSLALTGADVSFSVENANDIAIEASDVSLLNNDLTLLIKAIDLAKKTLYNIYQNFFWAFIYNIVMIPIAACGLLDPRLAGIGMGLSSIMVVLNSLRLRFYKFKNYQEGEITDENKST